VNDTPGGNAIKALHNFVERIERMEEEKSSISDDIKDIYNEAAGTGFDKKALRKLVALRKMDPDERKSQLELIDLYMVELGMV